MIEVFGRRRVEVRRVALSNVVPVSETYLSAVRLLAGLKETTVRVYELGKGRAFAAAGDSKVIAERYAVFEVKYDADAPIVFVRESLRRAYVALKSTERSLVLVAYLPSRSAVLALPWYPAAVPVKLIEECTPLKVGESKTCRDDLGFISVAVDPVYTYVVVYRSLIEAAPREVSERLSSVAE